MEDRYNSRDYYGKAYVGFDYMPAYLRPKQDPLLERAKAAVVNHKACTIRWLADTESTESDALADHLKTFTKQRWKKPSTKEQKIHPPPRFV